MEYEFIREIFNRCSGNQMRDVFVEEIETSSPDEYMKKYLIGEDIECEKAILENGTIIYEVTINQLHQRFSFSPM